MIGKLLRRVFGRRWRQDAPLAQQIRDSIRRDADRAIRSNWIAEGRRFG